MTVQAVIFDWGGTLTPWHTINGEQQWAAICEQHFPAAQAAAHAAALHASEQQLWLAADNRGATMAELFELAGVAATEPLLTSYTTAWEPHTFTDPAAADLLRYLRGRAIKVGVLSNTMWPRSWHEHVFRRDGVFGLLDAAVYSSEIGRTKPHPEAFAAAMAALGLSDPSGCVFVGDRPYDDVFGAKRAGMRAVLVPHSEVPPCPEAVPDAVIHQLSDLRPLIESWSAG